MIHFFWAMLFLFITILVLAVYLIVGVCICWVVIRGMIISIKILKPKDSASLEHKRKLKFFQKIVYICLGAAFALHISIYISQRQKWMVADCSYQNAKQYIVAGQPLSKIRTASCAIIAPDSLILVPLDYLQKQIFSRAKTHFPKTDAEPGIWADLWFVYPYSRYYKEASGSDEEEVTEKMIELLEFSYGTIRDVSTLTFRDKNVESNLYFKNFPRIVLYYVFKEGYLTGKFSGSNKVIARSPHLFKRSKELLGWLDAFKNKLITNNLYKTYLSENPKTILALEISRINKLLDCIRGKILRGEFNCSDNLIEEYVATRNDFIGNPAKGARGLSVQLKDTVERQEMRDFVINDMQSRFLKLVLTKECNIELWGDEDPYTRGNLSQSNDRYFSQRIKRLFKEELSVISGGNND